MLVLLMLFLMIALTLINVPIAIALAIAAVLGIALTDGWSGLTAIGVDMYNGAGKFELTAIPMFILAGAIMNAMGISQRLIAFVSALLGFIRGGLAMVTIGVSMVFAEISGSAVADVAALGSILIPEMKKRGYSAPFAAATASSAASLAIIIPPSIPMILYGVMANTSIQQLFVAGFIPGLFGGLSLMGTAYWFARRYDLPVENHFDFAHARSALLGALPTFLVPAIIMAGIFGGMVTATESAGLAVVAAIFVGVLFPYYDRLAGVDQEMPRLTLAEFKESMLDGGMQTAVVMLLVASSTLLGDFLTAQHVPQMFAETILALTSNKFVILLLLNILFLLLGCFLHSAAAIILVVPIILPLVIAAGVDPVHFGLIVTFNLAIGQQTPPVASVLMVACSIAKAGVWEVTRVNVYYIAVLLAVLLVCTYVPVVPMFLVEYFYR